MAPMPHLSGNAGQDTGQRMWGSHVELRPLVALGTRREIPTDRATVPCRGNISNAWELVWKPRQREASPRNVRGQKT